VTDAELVARARKGDAGAFAELVDRHRRAVYRAALAVLGSPDEADDAAQDAFVCAYRRLPGFRGDASFKTWVLTIAWNQAINRRRGLTRWLRRFPALGARRESATKSSGPAPEETDQLASRDRSPEQAAADQQLRSAIVMEIRALPAKLKDALLLAQSGEHTYDEIGAIVGAPAGTIKWRVSEARRIVKKKLRERGFADVG
jgi:RNA polymerase sigma-70 factor (ECF subfamily)